ncbi:MAG: GvpL/GvpF family gas vesicle protein [Elusimicrobia bacterium]|nr:GvpL/GvpF family gas vesicle protein [Elusimicrobiota bacterium]
MIGKYVYGVINSNEDLRFSTLAEPGGGNGAVRAHTVAYRDISAVVSDAEIAGYTSQDKEILVRQLLKHQRVIEGIMPRHSVIPMQLGLFARDQNEVLEILAGGYTLIKEVFAAGSGKIEIDVAAVWRDFSAALQEAGGEKEIVAFKKELLAKPEGVTPEDRIKLGSMVKQALDNKREQYAGEILRGLKSVSLAAKTHELMGDTMVLNTAFLLNKAGRADFEKEVERLNTNFGEKLNFRCVGPLPLYSFYTLETRKLKFEEVESARKKLRLSGGPVTGAEIKKAYHETAFSCHPDKNPDCPGVEKEFHELASAYKFLKDCCRNGICALTEQDLKKNPVLVKLRD